MKITELPDDLSLEKTLPIKVYDYMSSEEISKQQIQLNKNTFSFLQEGVKQVFFDNSSCTIDNSQFLLMKSGQCLMTEKLSKTSGNYRSILFFFSNNHVREFVMKHELDISNDKVSPSTCSFSYDSFIDKFVESLIDISKLSRQLQNKILRTKFEEIMLYLMDAQGSNFLHSLITDHSQSQKFIQTIESNQLTKLSIRELAFLSNMSTSTFKREFQKHFYTSPGKWFQEKRLEHAAFLLKYHSKRPSEIFEEVGYESLSNFTQAFKVKYGVTPKQYQSN